MKIRLTSVFLYDTASPSRDSPNTSRFASQSLVQANVRLIGKKPDVLSVPALQGLEGLWSDDYGHA